MIALHHPEWFRFAYGINLLMLVPVVGSMLLSGPQAIFGQQAAQSPATGIMVASFWGAILVASIFGMLWPAFFAPVTIVQVIYKATWLLWFALPLLQKGEETAIPSGVAVSFLIILATFPIIWWKAASP